MPSFPETVLTAGTFNGINGPFEDSGALWALGVHTPAFTIGVFKSTDQGLTWTEQDSGNDPAVFHLGSVIWACADTSHNIYVAYFHTDNTLRVKAFNMGTALWGAAIGSTLTPGSGPATNLSGAAVYRSSDNSVIIVTDPLASSGGYIRAAYARCDITGAAISGAWIPCGQTSDSDPTDWKPPSACIGASSAVHFLFTQAQSSFPFLVSVQLQQLSSANVLGALQVIRSVNETVDFAVWIPRAFITSRPLSGNVELWVVIEWADPVSGGGSFDTLHVFNGLSAASVTFTSVILAGGVPSNVLINAVGVCAAASGVTVFWQYSQSGVTSYFYNANTGSGFAGAGTLLGTDTPGNSTPVICSLARTTGWAMSMAGSVRFFALGGVSPVPVVIVKGGGSSAFYFWGVLRFPLLAKGDEPSPYLPDTSRAPRLPGTQDQNIMAPEWLVGNQCTPETPPGFWDEPYTLYSKAVANPVGTTTVGIPVEVPEDCEWFIVRNVQYNSVPDNGVTGAATVQIRLPMGYSLTDRDYLPADWTGPVFPVLSIKGAGRIILDFGDMDAAGAGNITTTVQFDGVKRRRLVS